MVGHFENELGQILETMMVKTTVEGRESSASYKLKDGMPLYSSEAIAHGTKPNLRLLADYLRSDRPVNADVRNWLADMIDGSANSYLQLTAKRKKAGAPKKTMMEYLEAVKFFMDQKIGKPGEQLYDSAVAETCDRFQISPTTLFKAWRSLESGIIEDRRQKAEIC